MIYFFMYLFIFNFLFHHVSYSMEGITRKYEGITHKYIDKINKISFKSLVEIPKDCPKRDTKDYNREDALIRYKYQGDHHKARKNNTYATQWLLLKQISNSRLTSKKKKCSEYVWSQGIFLLKEKSYKAALPLLLEKIDTVKLSEEDKKLLYTEAAAIKKGNNALAWDTERDLLYLYGKTVSEDEDPLGVVGLLMSLGLFKGLLLKITSPSFIPSLYCMKDRSLFDEFYDSADSDLESETTVVNTINNHLVNDSHSFIFLLQALPFAKGKYCESFLGNFFNDKKYEEALKCNIITSEIYLKKKVCSFFEAFRVKTDYALLLQQYICSASHHISLIKNLKDKKVSPQKSIEEYREILLKFLSCEEKLGKNALKWFEFFKYMVCRLMWGCIEEIDKSERNLLELKNLSECVALFQVSEFSLRLLGLKNNTVTRTGLEINGNDSYLTKLLRVSHLMDEVELLKERVKEKKIAEKILSLTEEVLSLKNKLQFPTRKLLFGGLKMFFDTLVEPKSVFPQYFLKVREIILRQDPLHWKEALKKLEKQIWIDPLIFAVMNTDIQNFQKKDSKTIENIQTIESLNLACSSLKEAVPQIVGHGFSSIKLVLFERAYFSMLYLTSLNKILGSTFKSSLKVIEELLEKYHENTDTTFKCIMGTDYKNMNKKK